ncbi:uncharacterized protein LOC106510978 [Austrofundulus limnaeus]|uniref:Uncharacterized protein LOC106510978 n=1 Tax=Austrofundulus limnaeus TaxID=52670 RepID=A0A2I4AI50_AUSLI|nr:PREDICTED: uncharacterized protein LOC106510978 [Austrofundulus limnaeus]
MQIPKMFFSKKPCFVLSLVLLCLLQPFVQPDIQSNDCSQIATAKEGVPVSVQEKLSALDCFNNGSNSLHEEMRRRKRKQDQMTRGVEKRKQECKNHNIEKVHLSSLNKCSVCHGPCSPLKWWGLRCTVCTTVWHVYCFEKTVKRHKIFDDYETTDNETDEDSNDCDPDYVPDSDSDIEEGNNKNPILLTVETSTAKSAILNEKNDHVTEHCHQQPSENSSETDSMNSLAKGQNFCFVCKKAQFKIARHFKTHEKEDPDIAKALSFPSGSKQRKDLLEQLRNRGNFLYNNDVLKKGRGSLKVKRAAKSEKKYEYCIHCKGMFLRKELWRHMRRCSCKPEEEQHSGKKRVLSLAAIIKSGKRFT